MPAARVPAGEVPPADADHQQRTGGLRRTRADVHGPGAAEAGLDDDAAGPGAGAAAGRPGGPGAAGTPAPADHGGAAGRPRGLAGQSAAAELRLGGGDHDLPAQPGRPGRAAVLPADPLNLSVFSSKPLVLSL